MSCVAGFAGWVGAFTVSFVFPFLLEAYNNWAFMFLVAISSFFWIWIYLRLVEPVGKTPDQIRSMFEGRTWYI